MTMSDESSTESVRDEFQDPLENYEPKSYDDPLEEALAESTVEAITHQPCATIASGPTVREALDMLSGLHVACLLVEEDGGLVGVFSDRDVLDKVALEYDVVKDRPVSDVMTRQPVYVYETDPAALSVMAISGYRHVPILDLDDRLVGIVSPQRVPLSPRTTLSPPAVTVRIGTGDARPA